MHTKRVLICGVVVLGTLLAAPSDAKDTRIDAVEAMLLASYNPIPEDMVVEIVLDPVIGQAERHRVLQLFWNKQHSVGRQRYYVLEHYLPRLEKMYREMPAEDVLSFRLILQAIASLQQERDQTDSQMREFLRQQMEIPSLSPARRSACQMMLAEIQGHPLSSTSQTWLAQEQEITALLAKGSTAEAYQLSLSILLDGRRTAEDRTSALRKLDQILVYPTGITFEQIRQDLVAACPTVQDLALATPLVASILRIAFLERMDPEHVLEVGNALGANPSAAIRNAATTTLAQIQAERQRWSFDLDAHLKQAESLIQQAQLDAEAQQEYQQMVSNPDYIARPVGQAQRWWFLGKFLWRYHATQPSVEAFKRYLQTREPCSRVDDYLREAVKILAAAQPPQDQAPQLYWADLARLPRAASSEAFVRALADEYSTATGKAVLVQFAISVLRQGDPPELAEAVLNNVLLSREQTAPLQGSISTDQTGRYCRTAIAAALAREGKSAEAARYMDPKMENPLPGVPMFRAMGVADVLFAAGKADAADRLIRSLLRRKGIASQRMNLLVYLLNQHLQAGHSDVALRIQQELSASWSMDSAGTLVTSLTKCIGVAQKKNPAAAAALMRLTCEILNGDSYPTDGDDALASDRIVSFWQSILTWSQDNTKTDGLEAFAQDKRGGLETDLARVLLARHALDLGLPDRAADLLEQVDESSRATAMAREERRRLQAVRDRNILLARTIRKQVTTLTEATELKDEILPAMEGLVLQAEFERDVPARILALGRAAELCEKHGLIQAYGETLRSLLDVLQPQCEDATSQAQCLQISEQVDRMSTTSQQQVETRQLGRLEAPADSVYARAMLEIGITLRSTGQYHRAVEYFHKGRLAAPLAQEAASRLLKEEIWTLRFYLAAMGESEIRLKQLVATYPHCMPGEWARTYLGSMANPEHPE